MKMRLKACRVQAGMLIKDVAQAIGVSEMTVINWEKGISSPEMVLGLKLSLLYKIPLKYKMAVWGKYSVTSFILKMVIN